MKLIPTLSIIGAIFGFAVGLIVANDSHFHVKHKFILPDGSRAIFQNGCIKMFGENGSGDATVCKAPSWRNAPEIQK